MKDCRKILAAMVFAGLGVSALIADSPKGEKKVDSRIFELRTYHAAPGKMEALNGRFRDHTCELFKKHGITIIGFWNPSKAEDADKTLIYLLAFPSQEAADRSWKAFLADPEWKKVKDESEKNGRLVEKIERVFLNPTDYSPMK
jgi:NIPSNAP